MKKIVFLVFALVVAITPAFADTIFVPFFRDGFAGGNNEGFITVQNTGGGPVVVTIIYTATNNSVTQADATFALAAGASIGWAPVVGPSAGEGIGSTIQDMTVHSNFPAQIAAGSVEIRSPEKIVGRYLERNLVTGTTAMYALR